MSRSQESSLLYSNAAYQILRLADPVTGTVIAKRCNTAPGADEQAWPALRNEQRILARLQGMSGCPRVIRLDPAGMELLLVDFAGVALTASGLPGQVGLDDFLVLAERLARILAEVHQRGVIHKDITPANILVRPEDLGLQLIDFGSATTFAVEQASPDTVLPETAPRLPVPGTDPAPGYRPPSSRHRCAAGHHALRPGTGTRGGALRGRRARTDL